MKISKIAIVFITVSITKVMMLLKDCSIYHKRSDKGEAEAKGIDECGFSWSSRDAPPCLKEGQLLKQPSLRSHHCQPVRVQPDESMPRKQDCPRLPPLWPVPQPQKPNRPLKDENNGNVLSFLLWNWKIGLSIKVLYQSTLRWYWLPIGTTFKLRSAQSNYMLLIKSKNICSRSIVEVIWDQWFENGV